VDEEGAAAGPRSAADEHPVLAHDRVPPRRCYRRGARAGAFPGRHQWMERVGAR